MKAQSSLRETLHECLGRRRTGPQQYTTKEGEGWGEKKRFKMERSLKMHLAKKC